MRNEHAAHAADRPLPAAKLHDSASISLSRTALSATVHCLIGCGIGEVTGLVIGTALGWGTAATITLAVALAFLFGFALTAVPLLRLGFPARSAVRIALAADAVSITLMELVDNGMMLAIPGAMDAPIDSLHFWASLAAALFVAGVVAYPVNRRLIARGRGHAIVHGSAENERKGGGNVATRTRPCAPSCGVGP